MNEKNLVKDMTLEEKLRLTIGFGLWNTYAIERLGLPSVMLTDGPHGIRKENSITVGTDGFNQRMSEYATCFPVSSCLATSWDCNVFKETGDLIGDQAKILNVNCVLGPGINHKRLPICGRNFEYISEDPILTANLVIEYVKALQSKGVACSLKHFCANNTERNRVEIDTIIDERTKREIYLRAFEKIVKLAAPQTIMAAYNKVDGEFCSENKRLLTEILREEWKFDGIVMSDWGALHDKEKALTAGCDLEMPCVNYEQIDAIAELVKEGKFDEKIIDRAAERIVKWINKICFEKTNEKIDFDYYHEKARKIAEQCGVLLKNDNILPLKGDFAIVGKFAKQPCYQGAGSSRVNMFKCSNAYDELKKVKSDICYYDYEDDFSGIKAETVVIFAGNDDKTETEGADRASMSLPTNQIDAITRLRGLNKKIALVLQTGAPIEMPFANDCLAILQTYFNGEASGEVIKDFLIGNISPCGKLTETYPIEHKDTPAYETYLKYNDKMIYDEGLFTGYRYYTSKNIKTQFCFGHGLTYSKFEFTQAEIDVRNDSLQISVYVKNIGEFFTKEIVQIYVGKRNSKVTRPKRELKGFGAKYIMPNETKTIVIDIPFSDLAYYDIKDGWVVEKGEYEIYISKSVNDTVFTKNIII